MASRKYEKKNLSYWSGLRKTDNYNIKSNILPFAQNADDLAPYLGGTPIYNFSKASYTRTTNTSKRTSRTNSLSITENPDKYVNLNNLTLPFDYEGGVVDVSEAITLCQKAYFHIPIFKNTIDLMSDMSNTKLIIEGKNENSKEFVKKWLDIIDIENIKEQYFRELFRSGNVFFFRLLASFASEEILAMRKIYSIDKLFSAQAGLEEKTRLPIKYVLLNPADIVCQATIGLGVGLYKRVLRNFEIERLKGQKTEEDKKAYEALPEEVKSGINKGLSRDLYINLNSENLAISFYKKQDYEPFSIPYGFSVLDDINWKMELKNVDRAVSKTVENIILLVTAGNEPEKGGVNANNLKILKDLFSNESVGRVLIADYTTKAQFIIPDITKIIGAEKYAIVNQDIKEGLQNVLFEDTKYSDNDTKVQVFIDRLKEARTCFLNNFLLKEVQNVCKLVGFKDIPDVKFDDSTSYNKEQLSKVAMRLMELGVLTPELGVKAIQDNKLPEITEIGKGQEEYAKRRKKGEYTPLIGSVPLLEDPTLKGGPTPVPKKPTGRPSSKASEESVEMISKQSLIDICSLASVFESNAEKSFKTIKGIKKLNSDHKNIITNICNSIVSSSGPDNWLKNAEMCFSGKAEDNILEPIPQILEVAKQYNVDTYQAALIYHSKNKTV